MTPELIQLAKELGFAACFVFAPDPFPQYERRRNDGALHTNGLQLSANPQSDFPWANAIVTLLRTYRPYAAGVPLSGYYESSNHTYHAATTLLERLNERGLRAERVYVPVRELLLRNHAGVALKNGLTAVPPYGTRFTVQTLAVHLPDCSYTECALPAEKTLCDTCTLCEKACPSGAIGCDGYDFHQCMRAFMRKDVMPEWVMARMTTMLGCEQCQNACPYNREVGTKRNLPDAFAYEKLLRHDLAEALSLVGTNQKSGGRIEAHAAILAAREGRTDLLPLIEALMADPRALVRESARYARMRLRETE